MTALKTNLESDPWETGELGRDERFVRASPKAQHGADNGEVMAWLNADDTKDAISDIKKHSMERSLGIGAAQLAEKYSIPLVRADTKPPANQVPDVKWRMKIGKPKRLWTDLKDVPFSKLQKEIDNWTEHGFAGAIFCSPDGVEQYHVDIDLRALLSAQPDAGAGQWIACSERLPTEDDADINGKVWCFMPERTLSEVCMFGAKEVEFFWNRDRTITHWMPTGLTRPAPPEQE